MEGYPVVVDFTITDKSVQQEERAPYLLLVIRLIHDFFTILLT
jgi:hypothetical protein